MFYNAGDFWTATAKNKRHDENKASNMRTCLTTFRLIFEFGAVQKCVHLGALVKSFHASTSIYLQRLASIQPRTGLSKFAKN